MAKHRPFHQSPPTWPERLSGPILALAAFIVYAATGAPGLMTGDQAEHQWVAHVVGVPHPTGYPLWTMTNALAVRLLPFIDSARPVTLMAGLWAALAVWALVDLARRLTGSALAGLLAGTTLALMQEWRLLATIADVYTLHVLLMLLLLANLLTWWRDDSLDQPPGWRHPLCRAALLSGLGITHHGSFGPIVLPGLLLAVAWPLILRLRVAAERGPALRLGGAALLWGLLGCAPWLYLAAQFALFQPFDFYRGQGLPYHPYHGNPASWGDVANLAFGGGFRGSIFTHGWARFGQLFAAFLTTMRLELWWFVLLALPGYGWLLRRQRSLAIMTGMIWLMTVVFGINVAAGVPKAHVYYLPALAMAALWTGVGGWALIDFSASRFPAALKRWAGPIVAALIVAGVARNLRYLDRRSSASSILPRQIAEARLAAVPDNAVILCRWEECMPLRYLQLVEGRKTHVQLDQTEPEDGTSWADRAAIYAGLPVYAASFNDQLAARYPVRPASEFADLWEVVRQP